MGFTKKDLIAGFIIGFIFFLLILILMDSGLKRSLPRENVLPKSIGIIHYSIYLCEKGGPFIENSQLFEI